MEPSNGIDVFYQFEDEYYTFRLFHVVGALSGLQCQIVSSRLHEQISKKIFFDLEENLAVISIVLASDTKKSFQALLPLDFLLSCSYNIYALSAAAQCLVMKYH